MNDLDELDEHDLGYFDLLPSSVDKQRVLMISTSQVETFELCRRKWWFRWVDRMPVGSKHALVLGTVAHGVIERYLAADDQGRLNGVPVELYPAGWDAEITPAEAAQVKAVVNHAISKGHLVRHHGREIEKKYVLHMTDLDDGTPVWFGLQIDVAVMNQHLIEDHKTRKNRTYIKSAKKLAEDAQLQSYAYALNQRILAEGGEPPEEWHVAHVNFVKDPQDIFTRRVAAKIPTERINARWEYMQTVAAEMKSLRGVSRWNQIPDPKDPQHACRAYGDCPYLAICTKAKPHELYRLHAEKAKEEQKKTMSTTNGKAPGFANRTGAAVGQIAPPVATSPPPINGAPPAHAADLQWWVILAPGNQPSKHLTPAVQEMVNTCGTGIKVCQVGQTAWKTAAEVGFQQVVLGVPVPETPPPPPAEAPPPPPAAAPAPPPAPAPGPVQTPAPWARAGCTGCGGTGYNSKGAACKPCDSLQAQEGKVTSENYKITQNPDGTRTAELIVKDLGAAPPPAAPTGAPPVAEPPPPSDDTEAPAPDGTTGKGKRGPGRPPKGFSLHIGIVPFKGVVSGAVSAHDLHKEIADKIAAASNAPFQSLDPFKRADAVALALPEALKDVGTKSIYFANVPSPGSDLGRFLDALLPHAAFAWTRSA